MCVRCCEHAVLPSGHVRLQAACKTQAVPNTLSCYSNFISVDYLVPTRSCIMIFRVSRCHYPSQWIVYIFIFRIPTSHGLSPE